MSEVKRRDQLRVRLEAGWILVSVDIGGYDQAGSSVGSASVLEYLFVALEGFVGPVLRNLGEQAMLDGIPLGGAGRVMGNGDGNAEGIAYLSLEFDLPGQGSATVATAGVGQNQ